MVVFVQNITSKEVIQAAYSEETGSVSDAESVNRPAEEVRVYPNPSKGIFNISGVCGADIQIFDASGRELLSLCNAQCLETVDLTPHKKGIYLLKGRNEEDMSFCKLLLN